MTKENIKRLEDALLDYVERVTEGRATHETEVEALPQVARVLVELIKFTT